jgi:hypothetical protein
MRSGWDVTDKLKPTIFAVFKRRLPITLIRLHTEKMFNTRLHLHWIFASAALNITMTSRNPAAQIQDVRAA